jgi:hypothetical protein
MQRQSVDCPLRREGRRQEGRRSEGGGRKPQTDKAYRGRKDRDLL